VPTKKTIELPTVKSKFASLAAKKPKAGKLNGKLISKNGLGKQSTVSKLNSEFNWYDEAKRRLSISDKREVQGGNSA